MSIASKLSTLAGIKSDIKTAINNKGQSVGDDMTEYAAAIGNIQGTYQEKTADPSTSQQVISPDSEYDALSSVTISAVTSSIDVNILAENIKKDVSILGVTGTYEGFGGCCLYYEEILTEVSAFTPTWDTLYQWRVNPSSITINTPGTPSDGTKEVVLRFTTGSTAPTISLPAIIHWKGGTAPTFAANTGYEISFAFDMFAECIIATYGEF